MTEREDHDWQVGLVGIASISGNASDSAILASSTVDRLAMAAPSDEILLGVSHDPNVVLLIADVAGPDVVFIGDCTQPYSQALQAFAKSRASTEIDQLKLLAAGDDAAARALHEFVEPTTQVPVEWLDQDPETRMIDEEFTPKSALDTMDGVLLKLSLPDSWSRDSFRLCSKSKMGWNNCARLDASVGSVDSEGPYVHTRYVAGERLELWIFDGLVLKPDTTRGWMFGSIATDSIADGSTVELTTDSTLSLRSLVEQANAGTNVGDLLFVAPKS